MPIQEYCFKGWGEESRRTHWYSSAVRAGALIECSGQGMAFLAQGRANSSGGFYQSGDSFAVHKDVNDEIDQAFENCDLALKAAGSNWSQVIKINSYHIPLSDEQQDAMVRNFKKWMPERHPTWTCIEVPRLGHPDMRVEIQVTAWDEEGSK